MLKKDKDVAIQALNIAIDLDKKIYKKAMEEPIFIPIKGYINYPDLDEDEIEEQEEKKISKSEKVRKHLKETYNIVGKLNYKELGVRYSNTKEKTENKIEERQLEQ